MKWVKASNPLNDNLTLPKAGVTVYIRYGDGDKDCGTRDLIKELYDNGYDNVEYLEESPAPDRWVSVEEEKSGPEVRDSHKWPPDKDGWYWCIVEGIPSALGRRIVKLEFSKSEGGFLQEDDDFRVLSYLFDYEDFKIVYQPPKQ